MADHKFPNRPTHPDFERLAAVCRAVDDIAEKPDFDFLTHLAKYLDPDTLCYVAEQRALRVEQRMEVTTPLDAALMVSWLDGFTMARELGLAGPVPRDGQRRPR